VPGISSPFSGNPYLLAVGDFNEDGILDMVSANTDSTLSVLRGDGNGGFSLSSGSPLAVSSRPNSMVVGDFNGDGKLDLASVNQDDTVTIFLGDGNGGLTLFGSPIAVGSHAVYIAAGDFNGDGKLDLAVVNQYTNDVSILLGNGDGTFTEAAGSPVGVGANPNSIAVGDFNEDGKLDLAVENYSSQNVTILLGDGAGGFTPYPTMPGTEVGINFPNGIVAADFNGDGHLDLALRNQIPNIVILLGDGSGGFTAAPGSPVATGSDVISALVVGDFNGDGKPDLAVGNASPSTAVILLGDGSGRFSPAIGSPININSSSTSIAVGDFDGDGTLDFVSGTAVLSVPYVVLNMYSATATAQLTGVSVPGSGAHLVSSTYAGDDTFAGSTSSTVSLVANVITTTLGLAATPAPSTFGQQVMLTATLAPALVGALTADGEPVFFFADGNLLGVGHLSSGVATINTTALTAGMRNLTAQYGGDSNFLPASAAQALLVNKATPGVDTVPPVTASAAPNPSVYGATILLTSTAPPSATGQIVFMEGTTAICTATLAAGVAQCTPPSPLAVGNHQIVAQYGGDSNFNPAVSPSVLQVVNSGNGTPPPVSGDFAVNVTNPTAQTLHPGATASFTVSVGYVTSAFNTFVLLSITTGQGQTGLPAGATVSFSPPLVLPGDGTVLSTLTIQTSPTNAGNRMPKPFGRTYAVLALLLFPWIGVRSLRKKPASFPRTAFLALLLLLSLSTWIGVAGCGSGEGYFGIKPQTYTFTVTGTSSSLSHTAPQTITLNLL